jgi:hypothetical protein
VREALTRAPVEGELLDVHLRRRHAGAARRLSTTFAGPPMGSGFLKQPAALPPRVAMGPLPGCDCAITVGGNIGAGCATSCTSSCCTPTPAATTV